MGVLDRFARGVNAFKTDEQLNPAYNPYESSSASYGAPVSIRPDRTPTTIPNDKSIVTSIYTRIALDCASVVIKHVRQDDEDRYLEDIDSGLNNCLNLEANIDQGAQAFLIDVYFTLLQEGLIAILPVDTTVDPKNSNAYDVLTSRVGLVKKFYPQHVTVEAYNDHTGKRQEITLPKTAVAIAENPFYSVMNEPNSTLKRLVRKLSLLDIVDEASSSGKLDIIIQLPYVIKSEARKQQAEQRRADIEWQLKGSKYGIAYTDGTESITQLNRPAENNLMGQIETLTTMLYGQLGMTKDVMEGTADEAAMLKYWNGTIEPIVKAVVQSMLRTFLTKTARSQKQSLMYFREPFKLIPIGDIAKIVDIMARNEILSSNEIRGIIGYRPSADPKADQLVNSNMPQTATGVPSDPNADPNADPTADPNADPNASIVQGDDPSSIMGSAFDIVNGQITDILNSIGGTDDTTQ